MKEPEKRKLYNVPFERLIARKEINIRGRLGDLRELTGQIDLQGIITPLEVTAQGDPDDPKTIFSLNSGFRRHAVATALRAKQPKRFATLPCILYEPEGKTQRARELEILDRNTSENMGRKDVQMWEHGERFMLVRDKYDRSIEDSAKLQSMSRSHAFNCVRVATKLEESIAKYIREKRDIPAPTLLRWAFMPHAKQLKEFQAWQSSDETKPKKRAKVTKAAKAEAAELQERWSQAPSLIRMLRRSRQPKAFRDGAIKALQWLLGTTKRPPIPLPEAEQ